MLLGVELCVHTDKKHPQHWWLFAAMSLLDCLCWWIWIRITYCGRPTQYDCWHFLKAFVQQCVLTLCGGRKPLMLLVTQWVTTENESSHSLLMDDWDTIDCLMNLPCFSSRKKKERRATKWRKCFKMLSDKNTSLLSFHFYDSMVEQCYLNLPEDMIEDNPLDLENIKERQDNHEKQIRWQGIWILTRAWSLINTIWRMNRGPNRTLETSSRQRVVRKVFWAAFLFTKLNGGLGYQLDVYLSGEECNTQPGSIST